MKVLKEEDKAKIIRKVIMDGENLTLEQLHGRSRKREIVEARQLGMRICRDLTRLSYRKIAEIIGKRNHATTIHSCRTIGNLLDTSEIHRQMYLKYVSICKLLINSHVKGKHVLKKDDSKTTFLVKSKSIMITQVKRAESVSGNSERHTYNVFGKSYIVSTVEISKEDFKDVFMCCVV